MTEEYESIVKNDAWDVVPIPQDRVVVTPKWLYKIKNARWKCRKVKEGPLWTKASTLSMVDDLFLTGTDPLIHECKRDMASEYKMKYLGLMHYFLGLEVWQKPGEIFLSQGKYVVKILERFDMVDCKLVTTPMELDFKKLSDSVAGPILLNATKHRQHMLEPHHSHWIGATNLLRYLHGIITHGFIYTIGDVRLLGCTDSDWAGSVVHRKSTSGCYFSVGSTSIS
eukprot:PITA_02648